MNHSARFRINGPRVIHEPFEQEIVIVNLDSGRYYCLQKSAVDLWHQLAAGQRVDDIVAAIAADYDASEGEIERAIQAFVDELLRENLIAAAPDRTAAPTPSTRAEGSEHAKPPFDTPTLQMYTDMQDLLLLDPIHEVDDTGWPVAADPVKKDQSDPPQ